MVLLIPDVQFLRKTEVNDLVLSLVLHNVLGLQIPVHNGVLMQFLNNIKKYRDATDQLPHDLNGLTLWQLLLLAQVFVQRQALAVLHHEDLQV